MTDHRLSSSVGALVEVDGLSETFRALDVRGATREPRLIRCYRHIVSRDRSFAPMIDRVIAEFAGHSHEKFIFFREFHSLERSLIISEQFDGVVLSELLQMSNASWQVLEPGVALYLGIGVLDAVANLSELRKFRAERRQRITPNHIAITSTGDVKIIVFPPVTRAVSQRFPWLHDVDAWRRFRAPEDAGNQFHEESEAIFAVGALVIELLTGERVFERRTRGATVKALAEADISWLRSSLTEVSPELYEILQKAVSAEPSDRFSNANEFASALRTVVEEKGLEASPGEVVQRLSRTIAGAVIDTPQSVQLTGDFLAVDDGVYSSRGASTFPADDAAADSSADDAMELDDNDIASFPGELIDDRVQSLESADQLRGVQIPSPPVDRISEINREQLHYRTDEYLVLSADLADGEATIELSSDAIRVAASRDAIASSRRRDRRSTDRSGEQKDLDMTPIPRALVDSEDEIDDVPVDEEIEYGLSLDGDEDVDDWVSLDEESIAEAEILAEEPMATEDTIAPRGLPAPGVETRSLLAQEVVAKSPDSSLAQAIVLRQNGETDTAKLLLEAEFFGAQPVVAMLEYAQCMLEDGDAEVAEERLAQLVESGFLTDSDQELARYYLALAYEVSPQGILATRIFRKLRETSGDRFPDLQVRLERYERDQSGN